jgi:hypothetical protein
MAQKENKGRCPSWHATKKTKRQGAAPLRKAGTRKKKAGEAQKLGANPRDKKRGCIGKQMVCLNFDQYPIR